MDDRKMLTARQRVLLARSDLNAARRAFAVACFYSRAHETLADEALSMFGSHGPHVSGVMRDHFPDTVKATLRTLADATARASDAAHGARPPRVALRTLRDLGRAVATRDGSGIYGPQPD
jgi:hypothetical protein